MRSRARAALVLSLLAACREPAPNVTADGPYAPATMVARFRRTVPDRPTELGGGATTDVDSLLARYVRGVEARDTTTLAPLRLSAGEFAWLYYLDSPLAQKPYELDPEVMWMQMSSQGQRGLTRVLARFGGRSWGAWRSACEPPRTSGALKLYTCTVTLRPAGGADVSLPVSIVQRGARFKFTSFATSL